MKKKVYYLGNWADKSIDVQAELGLCCSHMAFINFLVIGLKFNLGINDVSNAHIANILIFLYVGTICKAFTMQSKSSVFCYLDGIYLKS